MSEEFDWEKQNQYVKKNLRDKPKEMACLPLLFSFEGRIGREQFVKAYVGFLLLNIILLTFFTYSEKLTLLVYILSLWPFLALSTKRYHDCGSAGWLGLLQILPTTLWYYSEEHIIFIVTPNLLWALVFINCALPIGQFKDNQYGQSIYKK